MNSPLSESQVTSQHTPGPWSAHGPIVLAQGPTKRHVYLAILVDPFEHCTYSFSQEEAEANAKLIAAAPDLLEAANEVLKHFMPSFPGSRAVDDCLVQLAAAVAKAE